MRMCVCFLSIDLLLFSYMVKLKARADWLNLIFYPKMFVFRIRTNIPMTFDSKFVIKINCMRNHIVMMIVAMAMAMCTFLDGKHTAHSFTDRQQPDSRIFISHTYTYNILRTFFHPLKSYNEV